MLLLSSISNKDVLFIFSANKVAAEEVPQWVPVVWWPGGGGAGGHGPPTDNFLGALKFAVANVKYLTKYVKSSLSTNSKW